VAGRKPGASGEDEAAVLRVLADKLDVFQTLREFPDLSAAELRTLLLRAAEILSQPPPPQAKTSVKTSAKTPEGLWQLFTDGASRGNPGPAGAGFVLLDPQGEVAAEKAVPLGRATNNIAEYEALRLGLEEALGHGASRLQVRLDSQLVVRQISGRYQVKSPQLGELHRKVKQLLAKLAWHDIVHIERGANRAADALANQAAAAVSA
jgi:ribonuclease HI